MSLLTQRLPRQVEVNGRLRPIEADFRLMIDLEEAVTGPDGLSPQALGELLGRFYPQGVPEDAEAAVEGLLWFYRCGNEEAAETGSPGRGRLYDFDQDGEALYTSFLQAFGIDLTADSVHWWQFRRLMFGLPADAPFAQRLYYRTADTSAMGKEQKKHYAKMKRLYALREPARSRETLAQRDERMRAYVERRFLEVERGDG